MLQQDVQTSARRSVLKTLRGDVQLPAFMPVGTLGSVKGLTMDQVRATGAEMVLANTYHLTLRPGHQQVDDLGGLHTFMGWQGPILTDSGGFQIYSLAHRTSITEEGAVFQSHIDGAAVDLSPERSIEIQESLGSDIAMPMRRSHVPARSTCAVSRESRWENWPDYRSP